MGNVRVFRCEHPLVQHKMRWLRDKDTPPVVFRALVRELTMLLAYEVFKDLPTETTHVETPLEATVASRVVEKIGLVPVFRAGLGMVGAMLELLPTCRVLHMGFYRDEETFRPVPYYNKLQGDPTVQVCVVLDPMLATGGTAVAACDVLKDWGVKKIKFACLIAAPKGIRALHDKHPGVDIHVGAVDERLNEKAYIVPGLGDAGDRQYGTT